MYIMSLVYKVQKLLHESYYHAFILSRLLHTDIGANNVCFKGAYGARMVHIYMHLAYSVRALRV